MLDPRAASNGREESTLKKYVDLTFYRMLNSASYFEVKVGHLQYGQVVSFEGDDPHECSKQLPAEQMLTPS